MSRQFDERLDAFFSEFGESRNMVLSTTDGVKVSSRLMSVVRIGRVFCFQTDRESRKYGQLCSNSNAALCIDNIQIEGTAEEAGRPMNNEAFRSLFVKCFKGSYDAYTSLKNERLFIVRPRFIERWLYINGEPYIETFDLISEQYRCEKYESK